MFRPRSMFSTIAAATAFEVLAWRTLAPSPAACPQLVAGSVNGVDVTIRDAMEAERRACLTIAGDTPWTACEVK